MTINSRIKAVLKSPNFNRQILQLAERSLNTKLKEIESLEKDIAWLKRWIEFYKSEREFEYQNEFRVYEIDDGETHLVVAKDADAAVYYYAVVCCQYSSIDAYKSDVGEVVISMHNKGTAIEVFDPDSKDEYTIKTPAEWAKSPSPKLIGTSIY